MSIIFNVFVIYTLFNQINCRVINDQINEGEDDEEILLL